LTNGISFEAMNNIAQTTKRFIAVLNDNEWSIAKNVGAISGYLNKLITHPSYNKLSKDFEKFIRRLPKGELALKLAHKAEEGFKGRSWKSVSRQTPAHRIGWSRRLWQQPDLREMGLRIWGPLTVTICRC